MCVVLSDPVTSEAREPGRAPLTPSDIGFSVLFEAIRDAVVVADDHGRIVLWNHGAEVLFGWTSAEAAGRNVSMLVPESHRAAHDAGMARFTRTGHGPLLDTREPIELPALRKDGQGIHVELTLAALEMPRGRFALALLRDVSDRVRLRHALEKRSAEQERAYAEMKRANDSLTAFTYVVSHDLKEPVRAIDTYLGMLREDHGDHLPDDARDLIERASLATRRLGALLKGLLDLSRVDRMDLAFRALRLGDVLESEACRAVYDDLLRSRRGSLDLQDGPRVLAPPAIVCQVLGNLILNGLRHNPKEKPRVRVAALPGEDDVVEVRVEDNGPGFPPAMIARFNATGEGVPLGGGFGLLIARRAVERLGGRMRLAASEDLGGASVQFTLPAAPP